MAKIADIEGIGPAYASKLEAAGVSTTAQLLERGGTPAARQALEEATGVTGRQLLGWINRADLMRVRGVGEEYSDLLEAAGVDSVPELAQRNAENLAAKMAEVNSEKRLVRQVPTVSQVESWVEDARELPRAVEY